MNICIWSSGNFEKNYSSFHLMKDIIKALLESEDEVWLIQRQFSDGSIPADLENERLHVVNIKRKEQKKSNYFGRLFEPMMFYKKTFKFVKSIKSLDAIFVQSTNLAYFPNKYGKKLKIPVTFNVQDIFPENTAYLGKIKINSFIYKLFYKMQSIAYSNATRIITISEDMKGTILQHGVDSNKVEIVYNWGYEGPAQIDTEPDIFLMDKFNVVYAGNVGVMQNVDIVIEAAELLSHDESILFHIVGNGVYREKLIARAKDRNMRNIIFHPAVPSEVAPVLYSKADINLVPLAENIYKTAFPSKTAMCFASNKPAIFAIGKESLFGQKIEMMTGCPLIAADSPKELAGAIVDIKNDIVEVNTGDFYLKEMNNIINSKRYVEIIHETITNSGREV